MVSSVFLSRRQLLGLRTQHGPIVPRLPLFRLYQRTPRLQAAYWSLTLGGAVRHPFSLTWDDLLSLPRVQRAQTIVCASNPAGGERIGHGVWEGAHLNAVLGQVRLTAHAQFARLESADGHVTSVPIERLANALIAYRLDGAPLTPEQGFPARLLIPGLVDHKQPRWIERIDFTDAPVTGRWEQRGYDKDGIAPTLSAIVSPRAYEMVRGTVKLVGYAYAGERKLTAVEVSIDGGVWMPASFTPSLPDQLTGWSFVWEPPTAGDYAVCVRAADNSGFVQSTVHQSVLRVRL